MPNEEKDIKEVIRLLAIWIAEIRLNNSIYWYDTNKASEPIALKLLNLIYDLQLEDLNETSANFPGLDLGDKTKKVAFQVTSRIDTNKIIATLRMVIEKKYHETFQNGIKFLILNSDRIEFKKIRPESILSTYNPDTGILYLDELSKRDNKNIRH